MIVDMAKIAVGETVVIMLTQKVKTGEFFTMIEMGGRPLDGIMAHITGGRETGMIRRCGNIVGMARVTTFSEVFVGENAGFPIHWRVTERAIFQPESLRLVIRVVRLVKVGEVTLGVPAIHWCTGINIIHMAGITIRILMFADQWETGFIMIQNIRRPGIGGVTDLTLGTELIGGVVRIVGVIIIILVTGHTGGCGIVMLKNAGFEPRFIMTNGAIFHWIPPLSMIGVRGVVVVLGVTLGGETVMWCAGPLIIDVAACAIIRH